jgi:hypothetical protein
VDWQPLSVRKGVRELDGPYEGVPEHLQGTLIPWLEAVLDGGRQRGLMREIISYTRAPVPYSKDVSNAFQRLLTSCLGDETLCLDVVDAYLHLEHNDDPYGEAADELRLLLAVAGSVWTVSPDNKSLQHAVDSTTETAFELAISPADLATNELGEAWKNAYGRDPNPSDAWDHAIKAVEAILRKIISPDNARATLGTLIQNLRDGAHKFEFVLTNDQGGVQTLLAMLQLMWPNPDRHGGPNGRTPTIEEARAVVQLAVAIVQWGRDGQIVRR